MYAITAWGYNMKSLVINTLMLQIRIVCGDRV